MVESRRGKLPGAVWWSFIRRSKSPELPVVLLEDAGALLGLVLALGGVGLTLGTGDPVWDGVGTMSIGVLLGVIAVVLAVEMKSLLIGEAAGKADVAKIREALVGEGVDAVIHLRTMHLGPEELLVAAKIAPSPELDVAGVARRDRRSRAAGPRRRPDRPRDLPRAGPVPQRPAGAVRGLTGGAQRVGGRR